jgi:hypothetical protein
MVECLNDLSDLVIRFRQEVSMRPALLFALALLVMPAAAQFNPQNVPEDVHYCFERNSLLGKYQFSDRVNPFYLRGDFDGDSKPDYAVAVTEKAATPKAGVIICTTGSPQAQALGAGTQFAGDDVFDFDAWEVYGKRSVREGPSGPPPTLTAEAIVIREDETASGLVFWDGKKIDWYDLTE